MNQELEEFLERLGRTEKIIIVEGPKDKKALERIGLRNIIILNKKPIFVTVEKIKAKEAIILTDLDKEGKKLYGKISKELKRNGIIIDKYFREWLQKNTKLSHIEGINSYVIHNSK